MKLLFQAQWAKWNWSALVLLAGLIYSIYLQLQIHDEVFFSGDAGVKLLMTQQFAAGQWNMDLHLPSEAWVQDLWRKGYYPFSPPFVYEFDGRHVIAFPLGFSLITAPFYAVLGYRGLYIIPLLAAFVIWLRMYFLCRRLEFGRVETALCLVGLIFGSYMTLYSAMFWEHLPATALAFYGAAETIGGFRGAPTLTRAAVGGALLGLAGWLRPENILFAFVVIFAWLVPSLRAKQFQVWLVFSIAAVLVVGAFISLNLLLYGYPLGAHSLAMVRDAVLLDHLLKKTPSLLGDLLWRSLKFTPIAALVIVYGFWTILRQRKERCAPFFYVLLIVLLFVVGVPVMVPNIGGREWGPRFMMNAVPLFFVAAGLALSDLRNRGAKIERYLGLFGGCGLIALGVWLNSVEGTRNLRDNYRYRILPALEFIRHSNLRLVVISHQYVAQELAVELRARRFFAVKTDERLPKQIVELAEGFRQAGKRRFLFIVAVYQERIPPPGTITIGGIKVLIKCPVLGLYGYNYFMYDCLISDG